MTTSLVLLVTAGVLAAAGVHLILDRILTRVIMGMVILGNAGNLLLLAAGGPGGGAPVLGVTPPDRMSDPLPQAMILTAIVITMGMTSFLLAMAYRGWQLFGDDEVPDDVEDRRIVTRTERAEVRELLREERERFRRRSAERREGLRRRFEEVRAEERERRAELERLLAEARERVERVEAAPSDDPETRESAERDRLEALSEYARHERRIAAAERDLRDKMRWQRRREREARRAMFWEWRAARRELRRHIRESRVHQARAEDVEDEEEL
ncbi:Na(+)/H(+) antiporter subunit C [Bailinhaonella thermotolerans]|uniref:Na(+)/H(+) antiporter subunit C n=1 Tax=Bailinhaonella thermotolerans TaxID=1070861 RepID=UPI00192A4B38|nr:Na(+)/H(+) antiporter subunit C [Bailinhaonella thermotolerans]